MYNLFIYLLIVLMEIEVSSLDCAFEQPRSSDEVRKRSKGAFMNSLCGCPRVVNQNSFMIYSGLHSLSQFTVELSSSEVLSHGYKIPAPALGISERFRCR